MNKNKKSKNDKKGQGTILKESDKATTKKNTSNTFVSEEIKHVVPKSEIAKTKAFSDRNPVQFELAYKAAYHAAKAANCSDLFDNNREVPNMMYPTIIAPRDLPEFSKLSFETQKAVILAADRMNREALEIAEKANKFRKFIIDAQAEALKIFQKHFDIGLVERAGAKEDLEDGRFKDVVEKIKKLQAINRDDIIDDLKHHIESGVKWIPSQATIQEAFDYMETIESIRDRLTDSKTSEAQRVVNLVRMIKRSEEAAGGFSSTLEMLKKTKEQHELESMKTMRIILERIHSENISMKLNATRQADRDTEALKRLVSQGKAEVKKKERANAATTNTSKNVEDTEESLSHPTFKCRVVVDGKPCGGNHGDYNHNRVVKLRSKSDKKSSTINKTPFRDQKANEAIEERINAAKAAGITEGKTQAEREYMNASNRDQARRIENLETITSQSGSSRDERRRTHQAVANYADDWENRSTMSGRSGSNRSEHRTWEQANMVSEEEDIKATVEREIELRIVPLMENRLAPIILNVQLLFDRMAWITGGAFQPQQLIQIERCCMARDDDEDDALEKLVAKLGIPREYVVRQSSVAKDSEHSSKQSEKLTTTKQEPTPVIEKLTTAKQESTTTIKREPTMTRSTIDVKREPLRSSIHLDNKLESLLSSISDRLETIQTTVIDTYSNQRDLAEAVVENSVHLSSLIRGMNNNLSELIQSVSNDITAKSSEIAEESSNQSLSRHEQQKTFDQNKSLEMIRGVRTAMVTMLNMQETLISNISVLPTRTDLGVYIMPNIDEYLTMQTIIHNPTTAEEEKSILDQNTQISTTDDENSIKLTTPPPLIEDAIAEQTTGGRGRGGSFDRLNPTGRGTFTSPRGGLGHGYNTRSTSRSPPPEQNTRDETACPAMEIWDGHHRAYNTSIDKMQKILDSGTTSTFLPSAEGATVIGPASGSVVFGGNDKLRLPMKYAVHRRDTGPAVVVEGLPQELHSVSKYGTMKRDSLFHNGKCYIFDRHSLKVLRTGRERNGLYYLDDDCTETRSILKILTSP